MCWPLTRRELLRYGALVAATPLAARVWRPARAFAQVVAVPINLELVTVTDSSIVVTWLTADPTAVDEYGRPQPAPADTVFEIGTSPTSLQVVVEQAEETPFHYAELGGLEPGRTYYYRASSNGIPAVPTQLPSQYAAEVPATGVITTLVPPPGELRFTMAWCNDLHIGELTSGLAISNDDLPGGGIPPGFPVDMSNPYWRVMARAAVGESKERGAELMLVAGDLTSEAQPQWMNEVKATLDAFGPYRDAYWVTRGNHDRAHRGDASAGCQPAAVPEYNDCLRDYFFPYGGIYFSFDRRGLHVVGLDTNNPTDGGANGEIDDEQFAWLEADLAAHDGTPTFVFGHHPVTDEAALSAVPPFGPTINADDAHRLESLVAAHSVVGVYSGHTHRNRRTSSPRSPAVPYIELGATKEYPGGYGLVRVYDGGYMVNFYKTKAAEARAWSERSRGEYLGLYPYYTLGRLADRNFVVATDLSDVGRAPAGGAGAADPAGAAGAGTGRLAATGTTATVAAAAAAALGLAGRAATRTNEGTCGST